jgi:hypothetical protein
MTTLPGFCMRYGVITAFAGSQGGVGIAPVTNMHRLELGYHKAPSDRE